MGGGIKIKKKMKKFFKKIFSDASKDASENKKNYLPSPLERAVMGVENRNLQRFLDNCKKNEKKFQERFPEFYKAIIYYCGTLSGSIIYKGVSSYCSQDIDIFFEDRRKYQEFLSFLKRNFEEGEIPDKKEYVPYQYMGRIEYREEIISWKNGGFYEIKNQRIDVSLVEKIFSIPELLKLENMEKMKEYFEYTRKEYILIGVSKKIKTFTGPIFQDGEMVMVPEMKIKKEKKKIFSLDQLKYLEKNWETISRIYK